MLRETALAPKSSLSRGETAEGRLEALDAAYRLCCLLVLDPMIAVELVEEAVETGRRAAAAIGVASGFAKAALLSRVVRSCSRRMSRTLATPSGEGPLGPGSVGSPEMDRIGLAVAALPPECRVVTALSLADELSAREIAVILSLPLGAVRARPHEGRALLRESLGDYGN